MSSHAFRTACIALALGASLACAGTLDKAREAGKITLGYSSDTRPYAFSDSGGKPNGYAIDLCAKVADAVKSELKLPALAVNYLAVSREEAFTAVQQGKIDLLCAAVPTLERRALVDFSIPIMLSGTGVALRADAPARVLQAISGAPGTGPAWRASLDQAPQRAMVAVVGGTPIEKAALRAMKEKHLVVDTVQVQDTSAGLDLLANRQADAFFQDRALLLDAVTRRGGKDLVVAGRMFRRDVVAMAVRRDDDDFRLLVDRALSRQYRSGDQAGLYTRHFGSPTQDAADFFKLVALPD